MSTENDNRKSYLMQYEQETVSVFLKKRAFGLSVLILLALKMEYIKNKRHDLLAS